MNKLISSLILATLIVLLSATPAHAVIMNLNGQTGMHQSFLNDVNMAISSLNNVHSLIWNGILSVARGGTGASSFTNGSVPFINNGVFSENNSAFYWDNLNMRFGIGTNNPQVTLDVMGSSKITQGLSLVEGGDLTIAASFPGQQPGDLRFVDENGLSLAKISFENGENSFFLEAKGGGVLVMNADTHSTLISDDFPGSFIDPGSGVFPEGLLQVVSLDNSVLYIGASEVVAENGSVVRPQRPGCLAMGDSDGSGVTFITVNDGVMTASSAKPSICQ